MLTYIYPLARGGITGNPIVNGDLTFEGKHNHSCYMCGRNGAAFLARGPGVSLCSVACYDRMLNEWYDREAEMEEEYKEMLHWSSRY